MKMSHTTISIKEETKRELKKLQEIYKTKSNIFIQKKVRTMRYWQSSHPLLIS